MKNVLLSQKIKLLNMKNISKKLPNKKVHNKIWNKNISPLKKNKERHKRNYISNNYNIKMKKIIDFCY